MTVQKEVVSILKPRLKEVKDEITKLMDEAARIESVLDILKLEDIVPEVKVKPKPKRRRRAVSDKKPATSKRTVADRVEAIMLQHPKKTFTAPDLARMVSKRPQYMNGVLKEGDQFKFIGLTDDGGQPKRLYMLEAAFADLDEAEITPYEIPSVQGTGDTPPKNDREEDEVVHSSAEGVEPEVLVKN